ncbi:MAG: hydrogenase expression protein, partial [Candidatus Latescibacteria bacterium]|nr:hydrogenase expression protein [bacterium]MBD3424626.1 hydrogenase expression protein [Candidatus Latescibacterota bacterium]
YIPTGGAEEGDRIILTKGAGIEGAGIIATDFLAEVEGRVAPELIEEGRSKMEMLSVIPEAEILRGFAHSMHDPTEGGIVDGLMEMAVASGAAINIDPDSVIISRDTRELCGAMGVDPMKIFSSGALLAAVPAERVEDAMDKLEKKKIPASVIGSVEKAQFPVIRMGDDIYREPVRDQLYDLWED